MSWKQFWGWEEVWEQRVLNFLQSRTPTNSKRQMSKINSYDMDKVMILRLHSLNL